jgi:hypothetical protein
MSELVWVVWVVWVCVRGGRGWTGRTGCVCVCVCVCIVRSPPLFTGEACATDSPKELPSM